MKYWFRWCCDTMMTTTDPPDSDPRVWKDTGRLREESFFNEGHGEVSHVILHFDWTEGDKLISQELKAVPWDAARTEAEDLWLSQYEGVGRGE